jgi:hypothetical protein
MKHSKDQLNLVLTQRGNERQQGVVTSVDQPNEAQVISMQDRVHQRLAASARIQNSEVASRASHLADAWIKKD